VKREEKRRKESTLVKTSEKKNTASARVMGKTKKTKEARKDRKERKQERKKKSRDSATAPATLATPVPRAANATAFARSLIRDVPDFPRPGILFKDITPLLATPRAFHILLDALAERFIGENIDAIVAIEARGFIFGATLAARLNVSFVPARKPGKLPAECDRVRYDTEYISAELEMHRGSLPEGSNVLIVDDVLATGGTALATAELVRMQGAYVVGYAFAMELGLLNGRDKLLPVRVESILAF
jgi:adenine phosphoribosyltransferase